ncbi:hypothetical protein BLNAU_13115 [Blattamonas nauphoetae]|uniref:Uncharacterized protein n=1 Tax=Blattamonas nauphoetae TaxID=2049346 RepID=A0ABQ9XM44_9EUKA|nr:hypothetical protein BLNAU_13115 [Blattamonas nauphoetae]
MSAYGDLKGVLSGRVDIEYASAAMGEWSKLKLSVDPKGSLQNYRTTKVEWSNTQRIASGKFVNNNGKQEGLHQARMGSASSNLGYQGLHLAKMGSASRRYRIEAGGGTT